MSIGGVVPAYIHNVLNCAIDITIFKDHKTRDITLITPLPIHYVEASEFV